MTTRPRAWPYMTMFVALSVVWTFLVMNHYYRLWEKTGEDAIGMGSNIRNGILIVLALALVTYGARAVWMNRLHARSGAAVTGAAASTLAPESIHAHSILALTGPRFVLEVRGLGVVAGRQNNDEIWHAIETKASNFESYRSQNSKDYAKSGDERLSDLGLVTGMAFEEAAKHAVERWPVPVFVWNPLQDPKDSSAAAEAIADGRQLAGLGATLFLWQEDANTKDPVGLIERLFAFFDAHPDVPQAILFSEDGSMFRSLLRTPGEKPLPQWEYVPAIPDSIVVMLVSRSDRVDKLIRPFAIDRASGAGSDGDKLWDFFWDKSDGQGPDGFSAYYEEQLKVHGLAHSSPPGTMQASWWQQQLPAFWKTIANKGPGEFKPTPYLPIRWETWQVKQFDNAPLIGYLHRPVDVKLTNDHGQPLKAAEQADALKTGWEQALATLPDGVTPQRVFYDTTGNREWTIPLTQALAEVGKSAPSLSDVHEGYDIGRRIADTGVSSTMVQLGLGLIAGYGDGKTSATITRRPDGRATIIMVSPDPVRKAQWEQAHNNANPFD